jgi:hypothetical protein
MPRIRMCDADREKYGGDEWYELEMADLLDEETGLIEQIEEVWSLTPLEFLHGLTRDSVKAIRALIWVCRWKQGIRDDRRTFRPKTQEWSGFRLELTDKERARERERDAGPPADGAEPPRNENTEPSEPSSTSTGSTSSDS